MFPAQAIGQDGAAPESLTPFDSAAARLRSALSSSLSSEACAAAPSKPDFAAARALSVTESLPCMDVSILLDKSWGHHEITLTVSMPLAMEVVRQ
jgi:hypothetical protein